MTESSGFLFPRSRYYGSIHPESLIFNANLQEFSQRVNYISGLHTNGKLSAKDTFQQIEALWAELERSKEQLGIGKRPFESQK